MMTSLSAESRDGTTIAYLRQGEGPAIVVVPGNNRMAHNYERLASGLEDAYTVVTLERRGRGRSGPQGVDYALEREIDDLRAVADAESAEVVFGHSYGGLVALAAALDDRRFSRLAVYEPGVSLNGSLDLSFLPEFERLLSDGHHIRAMALFLRETRLVPIGNAPGFVYLALSALMVGGRNGTEMRELMPTTPPELKQIARFDSDGARYATIESETLLLGGSKSPAVITGVLEPLSHLIRNSRVDMLEGADHNAPDESDPTRVASVLRDFFRPAP